MTEKQLHKQVCKYLDLQYPEIIYTSDMSGMKCTIGQAVEMKAKRCKRYVIPDLLILHPNNEYKGLFIEIKINLGEIVTKKGEMRGDKHIREQFKTLSKLIDLGYAAVFGCGFDHIKKVIDNYLNQKNQ